jgi:hypothetical protein
MRFAHLAEVDELTKLVISNAKVTVTHLEDPPEAYNITGIHGLVFRSSALVVFLHLPTSRSSSLPDWWTRWLPIGLSGSITGSRPIPS